MKKVIYSIALVGASILLFSCNSSRQCTCEVVTDIPGMPPTTTTITTTVDGRCSDGNSTVSSMGMTITTTCR